ncbi:MAG: phosphoribosylamine--glycine ligase [Halanaerobiaceae bacterium]
MKVLVVGGGGREHVLCWKLAQSERVDKVFAAPGNAGTAEVGENVDISDTDISALVEFAREEEIELTFVGPEAPLVAGIVPAFEEAGLKVFGPGEKAARLEGSKVFANRLMKKYGIPTADFEVFTEPGAAKDYIRGQDMPVVVKAEGLAAGKGVIVAEVEEEALAAVDEIMVDRKFGEAGERLVVEEFLTGEEATVLAFTDGENIVPMVPSQDHKPAYDNDEGPNTGGMGAYAPAPVVDEEVLQRVYDDILLPTVEALKEEGITYRGILYCGLMIENGLPRVLEYNVRFGDPEAQAVIPLMESDLTVIAEDVLDGNLDESSVKWSDKTAVCVVMASGGYPLNYQTGKEITGLEKLQDREDIIVFQAGTARKDGKLVTDGGRVLGVTALGNGYRDTIDRAYSGVEEIDFAEAHYRTDIGGRALDR